MRTIAKNPIHTNSCLAGCIEFSVVFLFPGCAILFSSWLRTLHTQRQPSMGVCYAQLSRSMVLLRLGICISCLLCYHPYATHLEEIRHFSERNASNVQIRINHSSISLFLEFSLRSKSGRSRVYCRKWIGLWYDERRAVLIIMHAPKKQHTIIPRRQCLIEFQSQQSC